VIRYLKRKGIKTILLSGDQKEKCEQVANVLELMKYMPNKPATKNWK